MHYPQFFLTATVTTPSGMRHRPTIEDNKNGTVNIRYSPTECGLHKLDLAYNGVPIQGSPFNFYVHSAGYRGVTAYGPGLSHGVSGQACPFTIVTKDAGTGLLGWSDDKDDDFGDGDCLMPWASVICTYLSL